MMAGTILSSPYAKYPLRSNQTRILQIHSIDQDGTLRCSFKVIDLDLENPSYYAISYFWGERPEVMRTIKVDEFDICVWPSHLVMLRGITRFFADRAIQKPYIWVDAVCIDQTSETEKQEQVKQMNQIYQLAESVLIWLGDDDPDADLCMTIMQWLGRRVLSAAVLESEFPIPSLAELENQCRDQFNVSLDELKLLHFMTQEQTITQDTLSYSHPIWRAWQNIASRPWFSRVWTLQELLLARQAFFICGKKFVNWQSLRLMTLNPIRAGNQRHSDLSELQHFTSQYSNVNNLMLDKTRADDMMRDYHEIRFSLSYLMLSGAQRKLEATKSQDHIYGKLGLVRLKVKERIRVDYNLSAESVFEEALRISCFHVSDDDLSSARYIVDLWEYAAETPPNSEAPSWLPFYLGQKLFSNSLSFFLPSYERTSLNLSLDVLDKARCRMFDESIISLDVFRVDSIKDVLRSPFRNPEMYDDPTLPTGNNLMDGYCETLSEPVSKWLEAIEELLQTVLEESSRQQARETFLRDLFWTMKSSSMSDLEENFSRIRRYAMQHRQTNDLGTAITALAGSNQNAARLLGSCLTCLLSRSSSSYCFTESGRFGRCVSQDIETGDVVCMIPHGKRLHIFRPVSGTDVHRRITTAWFCEWSFGEAAIQANAGKLCQTVLKVA